MFITDLFETKNIPVIVTYPGRFQPFHQGHAGVFAELQKLFGTNNVYILTSNDQSGPKSPFDFSDKRQLMTAAGVPGDHIVQTTAMYALPEGFDPHNTIFVTAVGAPDADRLNPDSVLKRDKKDKEGNIIKPAGSPGYYKIWGGADQAVTADQHGYVVVIPEIHKAVKIKGKTYDVSHGTECRNLWNIIRGDAKARSEFLSQLYGRPDAKLAQIFDKIPAAVSEANDSNFVGFMNKTLGNKVDAKPKQPKTGQDWYDNAPTMSMDNMPSYKHAFKFGMSVLQSMDAETKQHFAEADNDELFSYLMKLARKKGFEPKYFVEEDMFEVTGLFSEIFHDPSMVDWEWADLLRSTLKDQGLDEAWSQKYKNSINCSHPKGFSQKAHCAGKKKHNESIEMEMTCPDCGMCETHGNHSKNKLDELKCWPGYTRVQGVPAGAPGSCKKKTNETGKSANPRQAAIAIAMKKAGKKPKHVGEDAAGVGVVATNKKMARDPRYSTSMTVDVHPDTPKKQLKAFNLIEGQAADKITDAVVDFYKQNIRNVESQPVDDYVKQARRLLNKTDDVRLRNKLEQIFKRGQENPYIQGGIVTTVGALLTGGLLTYMQRLNLSPAQTNMVLQAVLNTVIPTIVSRINGKNWADTIKYTLASAGIGTAIAAVTEEMKPSDFEIRNFEKLDTILTELCKQVIAHQKDDPDYWGMVAACVVDPDDNVVPGINYLDDSGKRVHAERAAIDSYREHFGEIPEGSIIVTTLSPCCHPLEERYGESCTELINDTDVHKVYCGYKDPTQEQTMNRTFHIMQTRNESIVELCKSFADTFLGQISEDTDNKHSIDEDEMMTMVKEFLPVAMKELKIKRLPHIVLQPHVEEHDGQATFGRFVDAEERIYLGIADRHPVDILRTLAHELVHFKQYEDNKMYHGAGKTGSPIENEAHVVAGIIMRHFNKKYPMAIKSKPLEL
jgi:pyrimidine deaminase RibD-like protein